nr:hypothetical protein [Bryobacter sp.]
MRLSILLLTALTCFAQVRFGATGNTNYGVWSTDVTVTPDWWSPGQTLEVTAELRVTDMHIANLAARTFDMNGTFRQANDERASTLITPTGLPIEGGVQGAVTNRFGGAFKTPIDLFAKVALKDARQQDGVKIVTFTFKQEIPKTIPPGIYRVRLDYGFGVGTRNYSLDAGTFAARPFFKSTPVESHLYMPPIRVNGYKIDGSWLDAGAIKPRIPWVLLYNYNSNGYRGVVAEEDQQVFGISGRNLIQDDIILPLFDANNNKIAYSLEPQLFTDTIELRSNIPWNPYGGSITYVITDPDGETRTIGPLGHHGLTQNLWPSTRRSQVTMWRPQKYGLYTVKMTGVWEDTWGNKYEGGGTYKFWIAKRMTMATATFQGQAYPVGNRYGRDMQFNPAFPADVEVEASLLLNSDPNKKQTVRYGGKASPSGLFGAAQGMVALPFTAAGEYCAKVLAKYRDENNHLWVSSMRHAGIVYPVDSPIVARGKKIPVEGKYVDRGETKREGYSIPSGSSYLDHINFPYNQNDVLLIASEGEGANKIIPTLVWEPRENAPAYTTKYQSIGHSNVALQTSNGLSPHLFPEYITEWSYFYAAAPRPGFMGRFLV